MRLIVGLGNPGRKYERTRHNVGFEVLDRLANQLVAPSRKTKFEGETTDVVDTGNKLVLLWPHTYMNASGRSVRKALEFYKLTPADLLVVCDDLNLPSGRLRIRPKGSAGGQKGLADIIRLLNTEEFARLRVGIDRPPDGWKVTDYVLGRFSVDESGSVDQACDHAVRTILDWCQNDMQTVMSRHNGFSATA